MTLFSLYHRKSRDDARRHGATVAVECLQVNVEENLFAKVEVPFELKEG